jgi:hypothetical protein
LSNLNVVDDEKHFETPAERFESPEPVNPSNVNAAFGLDRFDNDCSRSAESAAAI